jgi:hypothetical protein
MRFLITLLVCAGLISCGEEGAKKDGPVKAAIVTNLRLPEIAKGNSIDTTLPSLRILLQHSSDSTVMDSIIVEYKMEVNADVINVFADSAIPVVTVDSIINEIWEGQDVCLVGLHENLQLGIPFHGLHRFPPDMEDHAVLPEQYYEAKLTNHYFMINDWTFQYSSGENFLGAFYTDAFSPFDTSSKYPNRRRQNVEGLMMEGAAWDGVNFRERPDSAIMLATYNEFVNKLEIFDKAGPFWTMTVAMIDLTYDETVSWGSAMKFFGEHFAFLSKKKDEAKKYLSDYIANKGSDPNKQFTDEDLRLLYPDRLRWNGFVSGAVESRYDPDMLTNW